MLTPTNTSILKLVELKVLESVDGYYKYSKEFEKTVEWMKAKKLGMLESIKIAHKAESNLSPVLLAYAHQFKSQQDLKRGISAYTVLYKHLERLKIKHDPSVNEIYAVYFFNENKIKVEDVEN